jgi:hypothetical protein
VDFNTRSAYGLQLLKKKITPRVIFALWKYFKENRIEICRKVFYDIVTCTRPTYHLAGFKYFPF